MCKVSVLVPVYNTEKTLIKCMDSILNQTIIDDIEIVIVNDGSTDNSESIINDYLNKQDNISYFKQHNQGLGATRNKGLELAKGEYIAFLDSDDWVEQDYYEKLLNKAQSEESDLVISSYIVEIPNKQRQDLVTHNYNNKIEYLDALIKGKVAGFSWNKLYKKSLIKNNNLVFPIRGQLENVEDQYFSTRCIALSNKVSFMNESNVHYIINPNSIVRGYQESLYKDILQLYKANISFFQANLYSNYNLDNFNIILLRGLIVVVNNEFKPSRNVRKKEKLKLLKEVIENEEYIKSLKFQENFYFKPVDRLYLALITRKNISILYYVAKFRCSFMHIRSGVYRKK